MNNIKPINQINLFGLDKYFNELINLFKKDKLPTKILFSGQKGIGKSTLSYHFINYVLSKDEKYNYDYDNFSICPENRSFKTVLNKSNPNFTLIDINTEKKSIDINQIRNLIINLNKSSFNEKKRFVLIDNIEFLNTNSINALLKVLEEPSKNVHFILINNNKKVLPTLLSRCLNFKISLSNNESFEVANKLLDGKLNEFIGKDLVNYYMTPGNIYNLIIFGKDNGFNLVDMRLKTFIENIIDNKLYKKDEIIRFIIFELIESYFNKISFSSTIKISDKYSYFLKRISETKKFNLDEETLFGEFKKNILYG